MHLISSEQYESYCIMTHNAHINIKQKSLSLSHPEEHMIHPALSPNALDQLSKLIMQQNGCDR